MNNRKTIDKLYRVLYFVIPIAFYLFFWIYDGAVWCADTASYVEMHSSREPLYPLYLAFCRLICGGNQDASLFIAVFGQSLLAGVAAWSLSRYLVKAFDINKAVSWLILFMPMATSMLCRFAAKRSSMYSNSILTESIAISVYLLFYRFCAEFLYEKNKKSFVYCLILCFVGISLRKQMYILLCLLVIATIYYLIMEKSSWKTAIKSIVTLLLVIISARVFDCTYNLFIQGRFIGHEEDNRFVTTMAIYTAEREYSEYIDSRIRDIYLEIYDICEENEWLMHNSPDNWMEAVGFFADNYDHIQIDTMDKIVTQYADNGENDYSWIGDGARKDMIREEFNRSLLPHEIPRLAKIILWNFLSGLVVTIAVFRPIFCLYALLAYPVLVALTLWFLFKWIRHIEDETSKKAFELGTFAIFGIIGNVLLVAMVIFTQTRYMIYNMPIFYMTMIVLLYTAWNNIKAKK